MNQCVHCHQRKGKRSCPALGRMICSLCCGRYRMVLISCPVDCVFLEPHERYQRERAGEEFFLRRRALPDTPLLHILEFVIYRTFYNKPATPDAEVLSALEFLRGKLSPLTLLQTRSSPWGEELSTEVLAYLRQARIDRDQATSALEAYITFLRGISGEPVSSNRFLKGLIGYLERAFPDVTQKIKQEATSGRIISPPLIRLAT